MSDNFWKGVERILLAAMLTGGVGLGVRTGTDPMREEFSKFREMATKLLENHEQRLTNIERLNNLAK